MTWLITVRDAAGVHSYTAIGNRDKLMDAAYDAGALSLSMRVRP
jgi:hypothetical protein